jgi:hypothetical protein
MDHSLEEKYPDIKEARQRFLAGTDKTFSEIDRISMAVAAITLAIKEIDEGTAENSTEKAGVVEKGKILALAVGLISEQGKIIAEMLEGWKPQIPLLENFCENAERLSLLSEELKRLSESE